MAVAEMRLQLLLLGVLGLYWCWTAAGDLSSPNIIRERETETQGGTAPLREDERGLSASAADAAASAGTEGDRQLRSGCARGSVDVAPRAQVIVDRGGSFPIEMLDWRDSSSVAPPTTTAIVTLFVNRKPQPRVEVPDWGKPATRSSSRVIGAEASDAEATDTEAYEAEATDPEAYEAEATDTEVTDTEAYEAQATDTEVTDTEADAEVTEQREGEKQPRIRVEFEKRFPPEGSWASASFSGYGTNPPMGPLLLACTVNRDGRASCDLIPNNARQQDAGVTVYRAWVVWGDQSTGKAFVSILTGAPLGRPPQGVMGSPQLFCCETTNNAEGCVACTGFPSAYYDPLNVDMLAEKEAETEGMVPPDQREEKRRRPTAEPTQPVKAREIFDLLPALKEQLGGSPDPENLPCASAEPPPEGMPTLGDIMRSRSDLSIFKAMLETSHIQQLVPCPLTFFAVADNKVRDAQGQIPPSCLLAALGRAENQRNIIRLMGRSMMLGKLDELPMGSSATVLYGPPARMGRRGQVKTWNNIDIVEKIPFDRGMIYLLNRNDIADVQGKELLRRTVYWWCLNDYLKQHPSLTRFVLLMVDNKRALPIIGVPPGPRPAWVARGNPGWFPPPSTSTSLEAEETPETHKKIEAPRNRMEIAEETDKPEASKEAEKEKENEAPKAEPEAEDQIAGDKETANRRSPPPTTQEEETPETRPYMAQRETPEAEEAEKPKVENSPSKPANTPEEETEQRPQEE